MSMLLDWLRSLSMLPLQLLLAVLLYFHGLKRRRLFGVRAALSVVLLLFAPSLVLNLFFYSIGMRVGTNFVIALIYSATCYLATALGLFFSFQLPLWEAFYGATCAYLTQHMAYCLCCLIQLLLFQTVDDTSPLKTLFFLPAYVVAYFLFARQIGGTDGFHTKRAYSLWTTAAALFVALVLSDLTQQGRFANHLLYPVCLLYGMTCCFFVLWDQVGQQKQLRLQHELDIQQQLWLQNKAQYEMSAENVELINRKCHDLKHQIAALKHMSDQAERDESIRALEQSVMIYDSFIQTGNDILDTVLTEKSLICEAQGITLTCVADGDCLSFMDAVDIYALFGNAMDNAIEAVSTQADPDRRTISIMVFTRANLVFLQLENYYSGPMKLEEGLPRTTKQEETGYHGFGLKSIRHTAEKYGGFLTIQNEDDIFLLRVTIPKYDTKTY